LTWVVAWICLVSWEGDIEPAFPACHQETAAEYDRGNQIMAMIFPTLTGLLPQGNLVVALGVIHHGSGQDGRGRAAAGATAGAAGVLDPAGWEAAWVGAAALEPIVTPSVVA